MSRKKSDDQDKKINREIWRLILEAKLQDKRNFFLTFLFRIPAYAIQGALIPLYVAFGLEAIVLRNFDLVSGNVILIVVLTLVAGILEALAGWTISLNATRACAYMQEKVFANYLSKDYEFYGNSYYGSLGAQATRLRETIHEWGAIFTRDVLRQTITVLSGLIVIAYNAPLLALITVLCMGFVLSYTLWSSRWRLRFRRRLSEINSHTSGIIGDALTHSEAVKSYSAEDYESSRLRNDLKEWKKAQFNSWMSALPGDFGRNILAAITIGILLILTADLYKDDSISFAIVTLVQLYVIRMIAVTQDIANSLKTYESMMGASYQPVKTMLVEQSIKNKPKTKDINSKMPDKSIQFKKVNFAYDNSKKGQYAVNNFSLTINKGEKIGIVGHSGSGKTTVTKLLLRFLESNDGEIKIDDIDISDLNQKDLRRLIAYVPQEPILFHRSIYENISYGDTESSEKQVISAAKSANVEEFVNKLPDKYKTEVGERGVKLSGGQRQRVAIARALVKDAPVLVLDEATSALDSKSEKLIQEALSVLLKNRTALVIAHRLSTIQRMDRIIVMDNGKIVQTGTHDQLLKDKNNIYAELWAHQSGGYIAQDNKNP